MLDWRPDLNSINNDQLLTAVVDMRPTERGYAATYGFTPYVAGQLSLNAGEVSPNAIYATRTSIQSGFLVLGTNQRLLAWTYSLAYRDVSRGGGYSLSGGPYFNGESNGNAFDMCSFGDIVIAAHPSTTTQSRSATGAFVDKFADITGAPAAACCASTSNFVFLGNCGSWSTVSGSPDILAWCAIGDYTNWAVNPSVTQASFAQFTDTPGGITALMPFMDGIVVFKANATYFGRYVGAGANQDIWDFVRISDKIGCAGHRSVINAGTFIAFVGPNDFYKFDGAQITSITNGLTSTIRFARGLYEATGGALVMCHDAPNSVAEFWPLGYAWNYRLDRWNSVYLGTSISSSHYAVTPCRTNIGDFRTWTITGVDGSHRPVVGTTGNHRNLHTLAFTDDGYPVNRYTAISPVAYCTSNVYAAAGDKMQAPYRVTPTYWVKPTDGAAITVSRGTDSPNDVDVSPLSFAMTDKFRFDTSADGVAARYHTFKHTFTVGAEVGVQVELTDLKVEFKPSGSR